MPKDQAVSPAAVEEKTPSITPTRTPAHGRGELRTGNPGNKGGPGRPRSVVVEHFARTLEGKKARAARARILNDHSHPHHVALTRIALAYTEGIPTKSSDPEPGDGTPAVVQLVYDL